MPSTAASPRAQDLQVIGKVWDTKTSGPDTRTAAWPCSALPREGSRLCPQNGIAVLQGSGADRPHALGLLLLLPGSQAAHRASGMIPPCSPGPLAPSCPTWLASLQTKHTVQIQGKACSRHEIPAPLPYALLAAESTLLHTAAHFCSLGHLEGSFMTSQEKTADAHDNIRGSVLASWEEQNLWAIGSNWEARG